jgi:uncharacterized protein (UPF0332 family)
LNQVAQTGGSEPLPGDYGQLNAVDQEQALELVRRADEFLEKVKAMIA